MSKAKWLAEAEAWADETDNVVPLFKATNVIDKKQHALLVELFQQLAKGTTHKHAMDVRTAMMSELGYSHIGASSHRDFNMLRKAHFEDVLNGMCAALRINPTAALQIRPRSKAQAEFIKGLRIAHADTIEIENIDFIWPNVLARGVHTALAGEGGQGKSQLTYNIAATISNGGKFPDHSTTPVRNVVILNAEDHTKTMFGPRLAAAGADMTHVYKVQAAYEDGKERKFSLQDDLHKLKAACLEVSNVGLIIIDPASSYMGGKLDGRQNTQVRAVLDPISKLAEDLNVAVLSVTHFNKGTAAKAIHRVMDSAAFVTAPRAVFGVFPDPDDGLGEEAQFVDTKNFVPLKTNIGPLNMPGWKYHMEQVSAGTDHRDGSAIMATRIVWMAKRR